MTDDKIEREVAAYYTGKLREHGPTAKGADWNSDASQNLRFEQLVRVCPAHGPFSLLDYGCGYGALVPHLAQRGFKELDYLGYDISAEMVGTAVARYGPKFTSNAADLTPRDVTVCSGIFNVRLEIPNEEWMRYILATLDTVASFSRRGFAFNMLTSYSDADHMRDYLYYSDPCFFFDHCKRRYSKQVALLHDYGLYEFTILVRLDVGKTR